MFCVIGGVGIIWGLLRVWGGLGFGGGCVFRWFEFRFEFCCFFFGLCFGVGF